MSTSRSTSRNLHLQFYTDSVPSLDDPAATTLPPLDDAGPRALASDHTWTSRDDDLPPPLDAGLELLLLPLAGVVLEPTEEWITPVVVPAPPSGDASAVPFGDDEMKLRHVVMEPNSTSSNAAAFDEDEMKVRGVDDPAWTSSDDDERKLRVGDVLPPPRRACSIHDVIRDATVDDRADVTLVRVVVPASTSREDAAGETLSSCTSRDGDGTRGSGCGGTDLARRLLQSR